MSVLDYSMAIKITFDRPIVSDPTIITGSEAYQPNPTPWAAPTGISSGDYSGYPAANALDRSTSTYWRASATAAPAWIGRDFTVPVTLDKVRLYSGASYRPNGYTLQASADAATWEDIASGNFANATGWNDITFTAATYRYWRVYITSFYTAGLVYVYELEFHGTRNTYNVTGWEVSAQEYSMVPPGIAQATSKVVYPVRKVTRTDSDYSVILWLAHAGRIKHPAGQVSVAFTGTLIGPGNAQVAPFTLNFDWLGTNLVFNPHDIEYIQLATTGAVARSAINYLEFWAGIEYLQLTSITGAVTRYHINDIPQ